MDDGVDDGDDSSWYLLSIYFTPSKRYREHFTLMISFDPHNNTMNYIFIVGTLIVILILREIVETENWPLNSMGPNPWNM